MAGLISAANSDGYASASVSAVIAAAGVSRPTFYEYFTDRDDAFLAAVSVAQARLLEIVRERIAAEPPECALGASIRALIEFASAEPEMARFFSNEPLAAGTKALDARDKSLAEIAKLVERSYIGLSPETTVPDFSPSMILGGTLRLLASRLRRGEPTLTALIPDLISWVKAYENPLGQHRWRDLKAGKALPRSPFISEEPLSAPGPLPTGRLRMSEEEVAENQRQRIMFAAARLAEEKGYNTTTIGDITKLARVDSRVLYGMFADKQEAFMAVHQFGFQQVMDVTAEAFFAGKTWPDRNWQAGLAFTQFLEKNPLITHVGFVEAYAVGPGAVQRVEDSHTAFAMLLQDGYQHVSEEQRPSRVVLEAIITTIFEIVYSRARSSQKPRLSGLLAHLNYLVLSPFIGAEEAERVIDEKLQVNKA